MCHKYNLVNSRLVWNSMLFPVNSYQELGITATIHIFSGWGYANNIRKMCIREVSAFL